jgi:hypothetical protein
VAARAVLMRLFCRFGRITKLYVDGGYTGKLIGWANEMFGYEWIGRFRNRDKSDGLHPLEQSLPAMDSIPASCSI